ncbi:MAG: hypothetical protein F4Y01_16160 [Gammaproteobacteria bacterium]|nr:hypothetical protein [Gammaproteobacteria bacterium]
MLRIAFGIQSLLAVLIGWTTIVGMCVEWFAHYQGRAYASRAELAAVLSEAAVPWLLAAIFLALSALLCQLWSSGTKWTD